MFRPVQRRFGRGKVFHRKLPMRKGGEGLILGPLVYRNAAFLRHQCGEGEVGWYENLLIFDVMGPGVWRAAAYDKGFFEIGIAWRSTFHRGHVFAGKAPDGEVDVALFQPLQRRECAERLPFDGDP